MPELCVPGDRKGRHYISQGRNVVTCSGDPCGQYITLKAKRGKAKTESSKSGKIPEKKNEGAFDVQIT